MTPKFVSLAQSFPSWPLNISTWTPNRHFKISMSQTVFLKPQSIRQKNNDKKKKKPTLADDNLSLSWSGHKIWCNPCLFFGSLIPPLIAH